MLNIITLFIIMETYCTTAKTEAAETAPPGCTRNPPKYMIATVVRLRRSKETGSSVPDLIFAETSLSVISQTTFLSLLCSVGSRLKALMTLIPERRSLRI